MRPLEPVPAEPDTDVVIQIPDKPGPADPLIERLRAAGLKVSDISGEPVQEFAPLKISGPLVSESIIEERRTGR